MFRFVRDKNLQEMSRSRKRIPVSTNACCKSQKKDKRICNRTFRRKSKILLLKNEDLPLGTREVLNVFSFSGDGKHYVRSTDYSLIEKVLRK